MAIKHCPQRGKSVDQERMGFGLLLLMASDQFHLRTRGEIASLSEEDQNYSLLAEFISINEYRTFDVADRVVRAWQMLVVIPQEMTTHHAYVDFAKSFQDIYEIELRTFLAMCFALLIGNFKEFYSPSVGTTLTYGAGVWDQCSLSPQTIDRFWKLMSADPEEMRREIELRDAGSNDFTVFRQFPLLTLGPVRVGFDLVFIVEKLQAGVFWPILRSNKDMGLRLPVFWGSVFENYVNALLSKASSATNTFHPNPTLASDQNQQLCDGIIVSGDTLVILEYKSSMLTAAAKYRNDWKILKAEVEAKFIAPKGVAQLAAAVITLQANPPSAVLAGLDLTGITHIFPVLLILESMGDSILVSRVMNFAFERLWHPLANEAYEVHRLSCIGISTLERLSLLFADRPLAQMLAEWFREDPVHKGTLAPYALRGPRETIRDQRGNEFNEVGEELIKILGLAL